MENQNLELMIQELKAEKVIIFGAGVVGEVSLFALRNKGIEPLFYCDNNVDKIGEKLYGLTIRSLDDIRKDDIDYAFVVAIAMHKGIAIQLIDNGFDKVYDSVQLVKSIDIGQYTFSRSLQQVTGYINSYIRHLSRRTEELGYIEITHLGWFITQRCTLNCKGCANLMPYFQNPVDIDKDVNIVALESILEAVDEIGRVAISGGEALFHKDFDVLLEWLLNQDKVKNVTMFTNATILPSQKAIELFKNPKMYISLSNYGSVSKNLKTFEGILIRENIEYNVVNERIWKNFGNLECRNRSQQENDELFHRCSFDDCAQLLNGKLHYCARSAAMEELHAFPHQDGDYFDALKSYESLVEKRAALSEFLNNNTKAPTACNYCNGYTWESEHISVASQLQSKLMIE